MVKVFVRAVHEAKWMNEMEINIYDSWFDQVVSSFPGLIPDGFIYLRASPDTCHKRMFLRKRAEEGGVSLDYLQDLNGKHESWLFPFQSGDHGLLYVSKLPNNVDWSLHPNIRKRMFYLDGDHMHSSIQKVPALVLDCEPDIDFSRDIEAKRLVSVLESDGGGEISISFLLWFRYDSFSYGSLLFSSASLMDRRRRRFEWSRPRRL
ncbi:P-loop containing nucleoside triphosphate hydrolase superfamily protein [Abeliophyllum distichum]|uniref:P-loop containing nucleoside triphosphate hydrolase superfamily protein n=1 Tax=Abeliophyllum distichum TaxID=126358 RepID=A0ABD1SUG4_9LAMI